MEVYDQMAQVICNRYPFNSTARKNGPPKTLNHVPASAGKEDVTITLDVKNESRAVVSPFPFEVDPLEISYPARVLPKRSYDSDEDFRRDFYKAPQIRVSRFLHSKGVDHAN